MFVKNVRYFAACKEVCAPCSARSTECHVCGGPTFKPGRKGNVLVSVVFVRDPNLWVADLDSVPHLRSILSNYAPKLIEEFQQAQQPAASTDVWTGTYMRGLMQATEADDVLWLNFG